MCLQRALHNCLRDRYIVDNMFHSVMPANRDDWNNQTYATHDDSELWGFGVDLDENGADQDILAATLNSSGLFSDIQAFPSQESVEPLSLASSCDIDLDLCHFTPYQPSPVMTRPFEGTTAITSVAGCSSVMENAWCINNSLYQTNFVNGRKRSACESISQNVMVDSVPEYSENTSSHTESTGSKPKRKRVQNARQRKEANVRERKRMDSLNQAFDSLKTRVPTFSSEKRLSRMETLRLAIDYISFMKDVLADKNTSENIGKCPDSQSALDTNGFSFTLENLEALQNTDSLCSLDYTDSSDSGNSSS